MGEVRSGRRRKAPSLRRIVRDSLGADSAASGEELLASLIGRTAHDRAFAAKLMAIARSGRHPERERGTRAAGRHASRATRAARSLAHARDDIPVPWPVRRLACLALEHEFLRVARPGDLLAFFETLGLLTETCEQMRRFVLQEGYSSVSVLSFAAELRRRIARWEHVHAALDRDPESGVADFLEHSKHECRLVLSRYLLPAEEVVREIVAQVRTTAGLPHLPRTDPYNLGEAKRAKDNLPPYERDILERLLQEPVIYWVAEQTPSTIHSLVEYPLGTVVLVIKPPGSDLEIELKRAGCRGERALDCVYSRDGSKQPVPVHHHFWGGSTGRLVRWELSTAGTLARLHRLAYGAEAPSSRVVSLSGILDVPTPRGDVSLVSYFGSAQGYGPGYGAMREAMKKALPRVERDPLHMPDIDLGGFGQTGKWLAITSPEQAFVVGTSSFRLERLATYLANDGDDAYFTNGLGIEATDDDRRRFADALLGEIVPHYVVPPSFRSYARYLHDAYEANQPAADATFLDVMAQAGHYLGFYTAMRMWSEGESFVIRNVGLRNVFVRGEWKVRLHFADHDSVSIPGRDYDRWEGGHGFRGMRHDLVHVLGGVCGRRSIQGEVAALRAIYRVGDATYENGLRAVRMACRDAYFQAYDAIESSEPLRRMFTRGFVRELRDWDDLVRGWTEARPDSEQAVAQWRREAAAMLRARDYEKDRIELLLENVVTNADDLERYAFLYRPELVR